MHKPKYTRRIPSDAEYKTVKGKRFVRIFTGGKWQWVPVSKGGLALLQHRLWHGRLRLATGRVISIKLLRDRESSESMLRARQAHEDAVRTGRALAASKSEETVAELIDRYEAEKRLEGLTEAYIATTWPRLREAAAKLKWETIEDVRQTEPQQISKWFTMNARGALGTKIKRLVIVKQFMKWLMDQEIIFRVPRFPKVSDKVTNQRRALSPDQIEELANASPWPRSLLYRLAFATLARRGALLALRVEDLDLSDPAKATVVLIPRKSKTKRGQRVPIPAKLVPDLKRLVQQAKGRPIFWKVATLNMSNTFKADLKRAKIEHQTEDGAAVFHSLRHSGATHLAKSGVSLMLIKEMGGWGSLKMLFKHYAHLSPMSDRAAIDAVMNTEPASTEKLKIFKQP